MDDLTQLKIVDIYTGKIVRASGREDLKEWLVNSYRTLTEQQQVGSIVTGKQIGRASGRERVLRLV